MHDLAKTLNSSLSPLSPREPFRLGEWIVMAERNRLHRGSAESRHVEPRVMDLLVALCRHAGEVVAKEALIAEVWGGTHIAADGLFRHVSQLRRLLEDDARSPRYVETVPKRGYRLLVRPGRLTHDELPVPPSRTPRRLWLALAAALVLVAGHHVTEVEGRRERAAALAATAIGSPAYERFARGRVYDERTECGAYAQAAREYQAALDGNRGFRGAANAYADVLLASAVFGCQPTRLAFAALDAMLRQLEDRPSGQDHLAFSASDRLRIAAARSLFLDRDMLESGKLLDRAFAARDTDTLLAIHRAARGDRRLAVEAARQALARDPAALGENWSLGVALYLDQQYGAAAAQLSRTLELYPDSEIVKEVLLLALLPHDRAAAVTRAKAWLRPPGAGQDRFAFAAAYVLTVAGERHYGARTIAEWEVLAQRTWVPATGVAALYGALNSPLDAERWLQRARAEGDVWLLFQRADPTLRFGAPTDPS